jgi:hypothetical protein
MRQFPLPRRIKKLKGNLGTWWFLEALNMQWDSISGITIRVWERNLLTTSETDQVLSLNEMAQQLRTWANFLI